MALPVYDNATASGITSGSVTSLSWSHTVGVLLSGALYVAFGYYDNAVSASGVTYNGVAMTKYTRYNNGSAAVTLEVWRLVAPPSGANTVAITMGSATSGNIQGFALSLSGVDQGIPIEAVDSETTVTGTHTTHSASLTPVTDALLVALLIDAAALAPTATGTSQTARATQTNSINRGSGISTTPVSPAAATTCSWLFASTAGASGQIIFAVDGATGITPRDLPHTPQHQLLMAS